MSLIKANAVQIGQSGTATENFTLAVPSSPDGTIKLARGNANATTQDVLSVDASGNVNGLVKSTGSTTARSLANRFADVVNVKDFGAVGDGVADDTAAIQAAFNACGLFGFVNFPKAVYKISSSLNLTAISSTVSGVTLNGNGSSIISSLSLSSFINITGDQVKISNFNFDSGSSNSTSAVKCVIGNANAAPSLKIKECTFASFQKGLELSGQLYYISENFFLNCVSAIYFSDNGMNSTITRNHILGSTFGITFKKVSQQVEGTRIIDNSIFCTAINGAAISFDSALECYIIGNIIDQTGNGTVGIYGNAVGTNTISRIKIISNWLAGGENSYCCFFANATDITLIANTLVENNLQIITAGAAFTNINVLNLTNNNSLIQSASSGNDIVLVTCVNISQFANSSFRSQVGFNNSTTFSDFTATTLLSNKGVFGGQSITGGAAVPTAIEPSGSIYMRTGAGVGGRLYVSQGGGSWLAVSGV